MPIKPSIPMSMQNRAQVQGQLPNVASVTNFQAANPMLSMSNNPMMMPYGPHYFPNQAMPMPGFIASNLPVAKNPIVPEPTARRKSIIDNINPFINEPKMLPAVDLLSEFPVRVVLH